MPTVTVPASNDGSQALTYTFSAGSPLSIAQQIANALGLAVSANTLNVTTVSGLGAIPAAPTTSGVTQELYVTGSDNGSPTIPAGYGYVANGSTGPTTLSAAPGTTIISGNGGGNYAETGSGAVNIVIAGGANTITAGGTSGSIVGGAGTDSINALGSNELIVLQGTDTVSVSGVNDTVMGGSNPATVFASSGPLVIPGSGAIDFIGTGTATASVIGSGNNQSVTAGPGGIVFATESSNNATVNSGTGGATIFGSSGTNVFLTGGGTGPGGIDYAVAGSGNETLNAASSTAPVWLSVSTGVPSSLAGGVNMIAGSGPDTLIAGSAPGSVTMTGGSGADAFVFFKQAAGGAVDVVNNFTAKDSVFIEGYAAGSASGLQNAATVSGGSVTLGLSDGTSITFTNIGSVSALNGKIQYG
jgi:hypothetical protein